MAQSRPPLNLDTELPHLPDAQETAWIEVIRKMEEVYSDLIRYEVDLEEKNKALEDAQRFITSVLTSMSDVLVVCDSRGRVQQVNQAFHDLTGLAGDELIGQPVRGLFAEEDQGRLTFCEVAGTPVRDREARLRSRDGLTDWVALNCSPRLDTRGRAAGMVLIGRPLGELRRAYQALNDAHAELKQTQRQLVQSEKMASLGRLVAGVAHELNNPISFIYGNVHTLGKYRERLNTYFAALHGEASPEDRAALRERLRIDRLLDDLGPLIEGTLEGAERVTDIVKNLRRLSFSRSGEAEAFELGAVIRTAVQWTIKGGGGTADFALDLAPDLHTRGHSGQIHQVMVNLVRNALDAAASAARPEIRIRAERLPGLLRVTVADNGPGIAPDDISRVFDPFFTTKVVGQGTGLGLWISYGIVKEHGGAIEAANRPEGGAAFVFTLPAGEP
ncbi:MAG: PAS domain-containing protein [Alphaproteobacteria bacterium]|nr:PAS domain-containing protein [Alphaproteobacteria bacterium]